MAKVIVIGAGPAGMMAAISAAENHEVILLEGNERIGKKLFITGKGRCNVTNAKDISEFFDFIPGNPHFLYSALYTYTNIDVMNFFENAGVKLKVERGSRVFPNSDKSSDIISGLSRGLNEAGVDLRLHSKVKDVIFNNNKIEAVILENGSKVKGDYFIITTGGKSYPLTGSTGIGFDLAKKMGHSIVEPKPSLVPIEIEESWVRELQGLSLRNIELKIKNKKNSKVVYSGQGEMLFTHFGISGPLVLSGSRFIKDGERFEISLDLKPALEEKQLDLRIQKDFKKNLNKDFKNSLDELLPKKLIPVIIELSGIDENKKVNSITKEERRTLLNLLKNLTFTVKGLRDIAEAIVTAGGVSTKEIDPSTMKSKIVDNLYFAGEVIDVDAFTGGYNVQIALSTGYLAGKSI
ncbi:NAD(P)/FAD-dependent oxidoreductase [Clostridium perfringens]|uniref:NAD(P)/FAD-dependent oxidoreductase n=1 Tax=Clostridium perfringens TaxID=1502 RepID=UPI0011221EFD|nr:NAD(P)/FAD-dependent oxidoreductase [Clostridium perfringens]EGT3599897.1 NAD(P)/FAD-dependent oxidoreductase [Clostridium perfringens]EHK2441758.1 NAD(P)/FAD-dependent oxidoreductase [Clostridium perfringens]ELC8363363.1 NAD(P)/FAD-dependent oxidoreductase [Clostridium perfringens]MDK0537663.1 NAD(P)/FAD-dependent oxidoreductase [Clostridium perfringens]MDK0734669.1 NAD(P)/FAD-dependent oxidoreductase [Clostridium perfringens]